VGRCSRGLYFLSPALLFAVWGSNPSDAADGRIEINHQRALAGSVTASDTAGYPVTLDAVGSYRLTSDLVSPDANTHGIEVLADDVTIDLNGFSISGPVTCTSFGVNLNCTPNGGVGDGVRSSKLNTTVMNGTVRGMGRTGVTANGVGGRVENIHAIGNGLGGIQTVENGIVRGCNAERNAGAGIKADDNSQVTNNISYGNQSTGIEGPGVAILARGNSVQFNGALGIRLRTNGLALDNIIVYNTGFGLQVGDSAVLNPGGYGRNQINTNAGGTVGFYGSANQVDANVCNGVVACP